MFAVVIPVRQREIKTDTNKTAHSLSLSIGDFLRHFIATSEDNKPVAVRNIYVPR